MPRFSGCQRLARSSGGCLVYLRLFKVPEHATATPHAVARPHNEIGRGFSASLPYSGSPTSLMRGAARNVSGLRAVSPGPSSKSVSRRRLAPRRTACRLAKNSRRSAAQDWAPSRARRSVLCAAISVLPEPAKGSQVGSDERGAATKRGAAALSNATGCWSSRRLSCRSRRYGQRGIGSYRL